jgi:hypothetical protein
MIEVARLRKAGEPEVDEGDVGDDAEGDDGDEPRKDGADREETDIIPLQGIVECSRVVHKGTYPTCKSCRSLSSAGITNRMISTYY